MADTVKAVTVNHQDNEVSIKVYSDGSLSVSTYSSENFIYFYRIQLAELEAAISLAREQHDH